MYLSRLQLDPRSRQVRRTVADRHALHRLVMSGFPDVPGGRAELQVLFRLEDDAATPVLLIQSACEPDWTGLPEGVLGADWLGEPAACKPLAGAWSQLERGRALRFRLQANPRKQLFVRDGRGPRVSLRTPEAIAAWLQRRAEDGGFEIERSEDGALNLHITRMGDLVGWQRRAEGKRRRITLGCVQLDGRLVVSDAVRFRHTLAEGVGGGRAFGLGLLSVAP